MLRLFILLLFSISLTSCYRMPTENDCSVVPMTNNPDFAGKGQDNWMPNMQY